MYALGLRAHPRAAFQTYIADNFREVWRAASAICVALERRGLRDCPTRFRPQTLSLPASPFGGARAEASAAAMAGLHVAVLLALPPWAPQTQRWEDSGVGAALRLLRPSVGLLEVVHVSPAHLSDTQVNSDSGFPLDGPCDPGGALLRGSAVQWHVALAVGEPGGTADRCARQLAAAARASRHSTPAATAASAAAAVASSAQGRTEGHMMPRLLLLRQGGDGQGHAAAAPSRGTAHRNGGPAATGNEPDAAQRRGPAGRALWPYELEMGPRQSTSVNPAIFHARRTRRRRTVLVAAHALLVSAPSGAGGALAPACDVWLGPLLQLVVRLGRDSANAKNGPDEVLLMYDYPGAHPAITSGEGAAMAVRRREVRGCAQAASANAPPMRVRALSAVDAVVRSRLLASASALLIPRALAVALRGGTPAELRAGQGASAAAVGSAAGPAAVLPTLVMEAAASAVPRCVETDVADLVSVQGGGGGGGGEGESRGATWACGGDWRTVRGDAELARALHAHLAGLHHG